MATNQDVDAITQAPPPGTISLPKGHDRAADFLVSVAGREDTAYSYEEEHSVVRRVDLRLLPLLLGAYFFQQLDKSSLSYVSIFGISEDAHLTSSQYSWLGSILYLAQLVMQPLAAFLLVKLPTGKLLAGAIFFWGASLTIMSACRDFKSLLGLRFCLGAFEAMIAPCCVAVTQMWWRRGEQTMRNSFWNAMNGVTAIIGSLFTSFVIGPQLYSKNEAASGYHSGLLSTLIMFIIVAGLSILVMLYLLFLNRQHARQRESLGKSAVIVDESMMGRTKLDISKAAALEEATGTATHHESKTTGAKGADRTGGADVVAAVLEDKGFADVTDLRNEDFVYVY